MCKKCYPDGLLARAGRVKQCLTHKVDKTARPKNSNGRAKKRKAFEKIETIDNAERKRKELERDEYRWNEQWEHKKKHIAYQKK
jgi:hypothetical protein